MAASVGEAKSKPRKCYVCGSEKHLKATCPGWNNVSGKRCADYTLAVLDTALVAADYCDSNDYWIFDSGSSRHRVNDERLLEKPRECSHMCLAAGGEEEVIKKYGSVLLQVDLVGQKEMVRLENVQFAPKLARNLITYGLLECWPADVVMDALDADDKEGSTVQEGSLMHFHTRLGHLAFDAIERMACESKNNSSKKDTGANAPIDTIGGVICSDLQGPVTSRYRCGNRYMINFVDHRSNYCRVFLARTKDIAAEKFTIFLNFFEKKVNYRIHVLRTDGGGEYRVLDPFYGDAGVRRQISEASNQASNGKAERMHRTILNMARCMVFESKLPLKFWRDAVQYAAFVLNRSPISANFERKFPLAVLTGQMLSLGEIVAFGSSSTVRRDPRKNSFAQRAQPGAIVGKSDETKGFSVYLPNLKKVVVTQHFQNIATLVDSQNTQWHCEMLEANKTRDSAEEGRNVANTVREADPRNYGEAMKNSMREEWSDATSVEIEALEANDSGVTHKNMLMLRLAESLYGLMQVGRLWGSLLHDHLLAVGSTQAISDMCLYYKRDGPDMVVVGVYVDDLLVTATREDVVDKFFEEMASLSIKNLGYVGRFLGMRIHYDEQRGYELDQEVAIAPRLGQLRDLLHLNDPKKWRYGDTAEEEC
ncbi:hypothetical protein ON010_g4652 [Phytophthora cinnamomi]|nr:hypothetical protein ON010_g4652 [Phytophthora cinnamomi]